MESRDDHLGRRSIDAGFARSLGLLDKTGPQGATVVAEGCGPARTLNAGLDARGDPRIEDIVRLSPKTW